MGKLCQLSPELWPLIDVILFSYIELIFRGGVSCLPAALLFAYAKTKTQISFAVTAKLISAFVFAIRIVQSLYYLNLKFQASSHLLWLYRPVCVGPGRKPRLLFWGPGFLRTKLK